MMLYALIGGSVFICFYLVLNAFSEDIDRLQRRLQRVGPGGGVRKITINDRTPKTVRYAQDTAIPFMNTVINALPNPDKMRSRLAQTGHRISLGEYLLINALSVAVAFVVTQMLHWSAIIGIPFALGAGLGLPHMVTGIMGARRIKEFLGSFPEAIDTMCRGLRSGLPVTESIAAVGREMPDPIGIEFHRIADGVRMGKTLEASMWEVERRIDAAEFRFLIIAMAIQKETGGNLAETMGNLADLIRRRRQLRLKIKAMSAEAKASAMIIGSLPFIMFLLLSVVNSDYVFTLLHDVRGKIMLGAGVTWMLIGWGTMLKMIHFEL